MFISRLHSTCSPKESFHDTDVVPVVPAPNVRKLSAGAETGGRGRKAATGGLATNESAVDVVFIGEPLAFRGPFGRGKSHFLLFIALSGFFTPSTTNILPWLVRRSSDLDLLGDFCAAPALYSSWTLTLRPCATCLVRVPCPGKFWSSSSALSSGSLIKCLVEERLIEECLVENL